MVGTTSARVTAYRSRSSATSEPLVRVIITATARSDRRQLLVHVKCRSPVVSPVVLCCACTVVCVPLADKQLPSDLTHDCVDFHQAACLLRLVRFA